MAQTFNIISLPLPLHMGMVNCYLVKTATGFILIDTGGVNARKELLVELEKAGCKPGLLQLIILSHGDFDHTGNAAFLRKGFGSKIAMNIGDRGMVERGDMFANRKKPNFVIKLLMPIFVRFGRLERFTPDLLLENDGDLSEFGMDARIISIPGHSRGSLGILTSERDLFCGDLFENIKAPCLNSIMDDLEEAQSSCRKLAELNIGLVYPGHGSLFPLADLIQGKVSYLN
jgi:glyoxylase-like metal-dependent hydrolase (beta-lactamase superfamily II)